MARKKKGRKRKSQPHPVWDRVSKSNYLSRLFDLDAWLATSDRLRKIARLLERRVAQGWRMQLAWTKDSSAPLPDLDVRGVHFMLMAFSVENLLKAALISANQPRIGVFVQRQQSPYYQEFMRTGGLPGDLSTHDLFGLAQRLGIKCPPEEEDLLRRLTRAAEWYGRYPLPIHFAEFGGSEVFSNGREYLVSYESQDDVKRIGRLFKSLEKKLGRQKRIKRRRGRAEKRDH